MGPEGILAAMPLPLREGLKVPASMLTQYSYNPFNGAGLLAIFFARIGSAQRETFRG
jgi:hypothetical protein